MIVLMFVLMFMIMFMFMKWNEDGIIMLITFCALNLCLVSYTLNV